MMLRRRVLLIPAAALLLTGCGADAVQGLSRGGTAETQNFRIHVPLSLYLAEEPESQLWDASFIDRSGYTVSVQDFDFGYEPEDFLSEEYTGGQAAYENGECGSFHYCGWIAAEEPNFVLKFAAGTQGRLLYAQTTVPQKKVKRAKKQIFDLFEKMEYIGKPIAAGTASTGFLTVDYPAAWADASDADSSTIMLHPAVNPDGASVYFSVISNPKASAAVLAQERVSLTAEATPDFYSEADVVQRKVCGYDAYIARLCYGDVTDEDGCVIQESAMIEAPQGICMVSMYYCDPGADEFLAALDTIKLTFNGE